MNPTAWRRVADAVLFFGVAVAFLSSGARMFRPAPALTDDGVSESIRRGMVLTLPDLRLAEGGSVVLFVNTWCPACNASARFYREIMATATNFVIVSDESSIDVRQWLAEHAVAVDQVLTSPSVPSLHSLGIPATPTLLTVDERGVILDVVVGKLLPDQEIAFLSFLGGTSDDPIDNLRDPPVIGSKEMIQLVRTENVQVLDVRDRIAYGAGRHDGAINIPWDELAVRARVELSTKALLVVDCTVGSWRRCRTAARSLYLAGFRQVGVLAPDEARER